MARKKKKRKYTKRANSPRPAANRKKKRKYTKRAEKDAPKRKYAKRAERAVSFNLPELLRSGLEQIQAQITSRTEKLIATAVGTEAPSVSAMLSEAAKQAENDPITTNLLAIRTNLQSSLALLANLENRPKRGRKVAKAEITKNLEGQEDHEIDVEDEVDAEADEAEATEKKTNKKVVSIKKKGKQKKVASILRKKSAEG